MDNYGHLDYETQSVPDLEEVGLDVYLEHPWTRIIQANYARGERAVKTWEPHLNPKIPSELEDMLLDPFCSLYSWGANFERQITKRCLGIDKPTTEWVCVMAASRYAGLPGRLEEAGTVLGLGDEAKLESGKELIKLFCEPVDIGGEDTLFGISEPTFNTPYTHPQEWKQFCEYGKRDIIAERAALKKIRPFWPSEEEWETWRYDSKWNETGWPVDLLLVRNAREIALRSRQPLLDRMKELTGLSNVESRNQVLGWVQPHGYLFDSLGKEFIARALAGECEMSPEGREVLELRLQTARSSISKYTALADMTASDARLRYQYTYYGAHTGRWAAHGVNVGNLFKPTKEIEKKLNIAVDLVRKMDYEEIVKQFSKPLDVAAGVQRSAFRAPDGLKFVCADLNAIEPRVLGYLARCEAVLRVFREGLDPYLAFGVDMYGMSYEDLLAEFEAGNKEKRTYCKAPVIGGGYALGPGKEETDRQTGLKYYTGLMGYARNMGIDLPQEVATRAIEVLRKSWKEVTWLWKDMERAAAFAIRHPGHLTGVGVPELKWEFDLFERLGRKVHEPLLSFKCHSDKVLELVLPSGRPLFYWSPRVEVQHKTWEGIKDGKKVKREYDQDVIFYHSKDPKTKQWVETDTFGGHLVENCLAGNTKVLTSNGIKSIMGVEMNDLLWDGQEWVSHGGVISQGIQETIEWLGIQGTTEHLILVGNEWVALRNAEQNTVGALSTGRDLVSWWYSGRNPDTGNTAPLCATAVIPGKLKLETSTERDYQSAPIVLGNPPEKQGSQGAVMTSSKTMISDKLGCTGELGSSLDVLIQPTKPTTTTAGEELLSTNPGLTTCENGYDTSKPFLIGTSQIPISTGKTTTEITLRAISGLCQEEQTPTIPERTWKSTSEERSTRAPNSEKSSYQPGPREIWGGTSKEESLQRKSFPSTKRQEVFDLRSVGPRNRFAILTELGPVLVHNCDQGEARDILVDGLKRADRMGFEVVGSTYDEAVTLVPINSSLGVKELCDCLATPHERYKGMLPLAAEGFEDVVYRKN